MGRGARSLRARLIAPITSASQSPGCLVAVLAVEVAGVAAAGLVARPDSTNPNARPTASEAATRLSQPRFSPRPGGPAGGRSVPPPRSVPWGGAWSRLSATPTRPSLAYTAASFAPRMPTAASALLVSRPVCVALAGPMLWERWRGRCRSVMATVLPVGNLVGGATTGQSGGLLGGGVVRPGRSPAAPPRWGGWGRDPRSPHPIRWDRVVRTAQPLVAAAASPLTKPLVGVPIPVSSSQPGPEVRLCGWAPTSTRNDAAGHGWLALDTHPG